MTDAETPAAHDPEVAEHEPVEATLDVTIVVPVQTGDAEIGQLVEV